MCGIAGIIKEDSQKYKPQLKKMTDSLSHRGPDAEGFYFFKDCGLGHRRLSIIDLKTGDQPMMRQIRNNIGITFNGEIYGFLEIRKKLEKEGYVFQTVSDTEVILALYEKYGEDFVKYLPGMFAFALWDDKNKKLICARDRFGEKPFYYAFGKNNEFIFASEIKAIIASGLIKPILDLETVSCYLKHLYIYPTRTIYKNIHILPASHQLIYKNGKVEIKRYWNLPAVNSEIEIDEAIPIFKKLLNQAVERQLIADVSLGAFLSGGLDSSTIVALASQYKENLNTFSFGFGEWINELPYALEIAKKYKTNHIELTPEKADLGELLMKMQEIYDEPFADSSNIPTYLLAEAARWYTKVVLTGDGGDEMLGGYGWYKPFLFMNEKNRGLWRSEFIRFIARAIRRLSGNQLLINKVLGARFRENFCSVVDAHLSGQDVVFNNQEIADLGLKSVNEKELYKPSWQETNDLNDIFRVDLENYITGDILVKTDRASMANGLELRAPFLDVDFASFCISLPYQLKISKEDDKIILRRAVSDLWTDSIRKRSKQGFGGPVDKWLKEDKSLNALRESYLNNPKRKIFDLISFKNTREAVKKNKYKTWALLVLSLWLEKHNCDF